MFDTVTVTLTLEEFDKVREILAEMPQGARGTEAKPNAVKATPAPKNNLNAIMTKARSMIDTVGMDKIKECVSRFGAKAITGVDVSKYDELYDALIALEEGK